MIKITSNLLKLATDPAQPAQPQAAPAPVPASMPQAKKHNYPRTGNPFSAFHAHGKAMGVLEHLQGNKSADDHQQQLAAIADMVKDIDAKNDHSGMLGPHTTDIPVGVGLGALMGLPAGALYNAVAGEDQSLPGYLTSALKGGLIGGGAGALSSGLLGYPYMRNNLDQRALDNLYKSFDTNKAQDTASLPGNMIA